jgi:hypothetical protein
LAHDEKNADDTLDRAADEVRADAARRRGRRRRPDNNMRDMFDLGPHYTKGQHFDMEKQERARPLFRIDGKNRPRRDTGA